MIVDGISQPLFAAKVSLGRLDAFVTEQELDLLKLTTWYDDEGKPCSRMIVGFDGSPAAR